MQPLKGYNEAQESGEFERLPAGGYVVKITDVKDEPAKSYIVITYDISEGQYRGFYQNTDEKYVKSHQFIRSYKPSALGMFKGFISAVDKSNGTKFGDVIEEQGLDERKLIGKVFGALIGEEEYEDNRGEVKTVLKVRTCVEADRIRKGNFKVPELKKLEKKPGEVPSGFQQIGDADLPF